jgi:D-sedoheptulose 7-phosphate isomerase
MIQFEKAIDEHRKALKALEEEKNTLEAIGQQLVHTLQNGGKILICGNGGSAADAQHFAAELVVRFEDNRKALPALALTVDTSAITACANDFDFEQIYSRQVQALANANDVCIGISTSGRSPNILAALQSAREIGCKTIGFTGYGTLQFEGLCDYVLKITDGNTARIQEMHILAIHILCRVIEDSL